MNDINANLILPSSMCSDNLSISEVSEFVVKEMRKNDIKKLYGNKIKQRKDGKQFYIYIDRKQYTSTTYNGLIEVLYDNFYQFCDSSLEDLYPEWLKWKRDTSNVTGKTLKELQFLWNKHLADTSIVKRPIKELKAKDFIILFRNWTKDRTMTSKYFNNVKSVLNGIYSYAIESEIVSNNPIKEINMRQFSYKPVNNDAEVFSLQERQAILEHLKNNNEIYSLAIQFDFFVVCRIGELLSLCWEDIDGDYIRIQTQYLSCQTMNDDLSFNSRTYDNVDHVKGNTDQGFRYMPLMPEAKAILERARKINPDGKYIFMHYDRQLNKDAFNRWLKKYCIEAGITPRSSHKIRFTVASLLYSKGVPLPNLQQLLGHTNTAMTLHYLRPVTSRLETYQTMQTALCM